MADLIREKLKTGEAKVVKKEGKKSKAWEKFGQIVLPGGSTADHAICLTCRALYRYDSHKTGTSNLIRHRCDGETTAHVQQPRITSFIQNKVPLSAKSKLVDHFVDFCCADLRPFDIVSGKGFTSVAQGLINIGAKYGSVDADSVIPHRQTVCDRAKDKAKLEKAALCEVINNALDHGIGITTDMWTDGFNMRSYTALTCHLITEEWILLCRVICTLEFDANEKKTAANIHDQISKELIDIGVSPQHLARVVFVTDQGPNIKAALKNYSWMPCAAHILNNILKHTFEEKDAPAFMSLVTNQIHKCKALVTYLKKSGGTLSLPYAVTQESETRWNTKVAMINSVVKQYRQILELLEVKGQGHRLDGIQVEVLNTVGNFLSIFKDASDEMEGDRYPTINTVLLWYTKLKAHCEPRSESPEYLDYICNRAGMLLNEKLIVTNTHKIATFLTPRFKSLKMLQPDDRCVVHTEARRLMTVLSSQQRPSEAVVAEEMEASERSLAEEKPFEGMPEKRRRLFAEWEDTPAELYEADDDVQRYINNHFSLEDCLKDVLSFWKDHRRDYPSLSLVAKAVLCIPATSASSERTFSSAGRVLEARRNRLNPGTVDSILFLHSAAK